MEKNGNGNEWTKWALRWIMGGVWSAVVAVLFAFNTRISSAEKETTELDRAQEMKIAELAQCQAETKVELAYIKQAVQEQKTDLKEILKAVKQ